MACFPPVRVPGIQIHPGHHYYPGFSFAEYLVMVFPLSHDLYLLRLDPEQYEICFRIFRANISGARNPHR